MFSVLQLWVCITLLISNMNTISLAYWCINTYMIFPLLFITNMLICHIFCMQITIRVQACKYFHLATCKFVEYVHFQWTSFQIWYLFTYALIFVGYGSLPPMLERGLWPWVLGLCCWIIIVDYWNYVDMKMYFALQDTRRLCQIFPKKYNGDSCG